LIVFQAREFGGLAKRSRARNQKAKHLGVAIAAINGAQRGISLLVNNSNDLLDGRS
jgi:hypothetical protein